MKPLNVLALASWYPNDADPFLGNFVQRHCEAIAMLHRVYVIYVAEVSHTNEEKVEQKEKGNLTEVITYAKLSGNRFLKYAQKKRLITDRLSELDVEFDLIHGHVAFQMAPIFASLSHRLKVPWVLSEHWSGFHRAFRPRINPLKWRWIMQSVNTASMAFPVSENLKMAMRKVFPKLEMLCVPNVVEDIFFYTSESAHQQNETPRFLHVSNLVEQYKNIRGTLEGFAKIKQEGMHFRLIILSDGDSSNAKSWVEELGLQDEVKFIGPSTPAQIADEMRKSDALVLFSNTENQPCVVLESISVGLPVVASDVGDIPNLITPERGYVSAAGDVDGLSENLIQLIENRSTFDRNKVAANTRERFSKQAIAEQYSQAYAKILNSK